MPRPNKIWYWKARKCWFVTIDGQRHKLSPNKKVAENLFYKLKVQEPEVRALPTDSVAAIFDDFPGWTAENRALKTYECYRGYNPITGMEKPKAKTRTAFVETAEFDQVLAVVPDEEFRDLLMVSWECGCRPPEVKGLEARHVDLDKSRWVFPTQEGKGERLRVVYMTEKALAIVKRLVKTHPKGPIFRNTIGNAWTGCAVKSRFEKIQVYLAELEMKKQEIESTVTEDAVNALAAKLPKNRSDRTTGKMDGDAGRATAADSRTKTWFSLSKPTLAWPREGSVQNPLYSNTVSGRRRSKRALVDADRYLDLGRVSLYQRGRGAAAV